MSLERPQIAIIALLVLNVGACVMAAFPLIQCTSSNVFWAASLGKIQAILMICAVPLLAIALIVPAVRTAGIIIGVLTLVGSGVVNELSARQIIFCDGP